MREFQVPTLEDFTFTVPLPGSESTEALASQGNPPSIGLTLEDSSMESTTSSSTNEHVFVVESNYDAEVHTHVYWLGDEAHGQEFVAHPILGRSIPSQTSSESVTSPSSTASPNDSMLTVDPSLLQLRQNTTTVQSLPLAGHDTLDPNALGNLFHDAEQTNPEVITFESFLNEDMFNNVDEL